MSVAIVTGTGEEVGRSIAVLLATDGYDIGLIRDSDEPGLLDTIAECRDLGAHVESRCIDVDVSTRPFPADIRAIDQLIYAMCGVDVFVNGTSGAIEPALGMRRAAWWMLEHGRPGRIVAVSEPPAYPHPSSAADRWPLNMLVKDMAVELATSAITINMVAPGLPAETADMVAWLASPGAGSVNGHWFTIGSGSASRGATADHLAF
jgi:NAD(P)-dependent dehydrogenase (short-subunit alcohol dehydrogenase family)